MKDKILAIMDEKRQAAAEKYGKRMDELVAGYPKNGSYDDKTKVIAEMVLLTEAYASLLRAYRECDERFIYQFEQKIGRYDEFFEAKLKGEPHEWDHREVL